MATLSQEWRKRVPQLSGRNVIIGAVAVVVVVVAVVMASLRGTSSTAVTTNTLVVAPMDVRASITATGKLTPVQSADMSFITGGRVSEVYVQSGDSVAKDAPMVQLDRGMRDLDVQAAEAAVRQAVADVAVATAQLAGAEAQLKQTMGSVTASDITAARATLSEAQARLALFASSNGADVLVRAQAALTDAQANLDAQRKTLATAKAQAETQVAKRANELRDAQSVLQSARADNQHVIDKGTDPRTGRRLSDTEKSDYAGKYETAVRAEENAVALLTQATRDADVARQNEVSGVASAEARVRTAQADLDAVKSGADLASAKAVVAQAEANLNKLLGDQRNAQVAAQEANVSAATASLERANARLVQAQAQAQMAVLTRDETTLKAPFAGVIADVHAKPGELVTTAPVVGIIDMSVFSVEITVDEVDVAKVQVGQVVDVFVDALGEPALVGSVVRVSPRAESDQGVVSYKVTVEVTPDARNVRAGMTASARIITGEAKSAIAVPRTAITTVDGVHTVTVVNGDARTTQTVELGVVGDDMVEIRSGLKAGDIIALSEGTSK